MNKVHSSVKVAIFLVIIICNNKMIINREKIHEYFSQEFSGINFNIKN